MLPKLQLNRQQHPADAGRPRLPIALPLSCSLPCVNGSDSAVAVKPPLSLIKANSNSLNQNNKNIPSRASGLKNDKPRTTNPNQQHSAAERCRPLSLIVDYCRFSKKVAKSRHCNSKPLYHKELQLRKRPVLSSTALTAIRHSSLVIRGGSFVIRHSLHSPC